MDLYLEMLLWFYFLLLFMVFFAIWKFDLLFELEMDLC